MSGRLHLEPAADVTANVYARYASTDSTTFPEQSGGPELAVLRDLQRANADDFTLGADADWAINTVWSVQALASLYDRSDEYASPGIAPGDQVPPNGAANDLERENAALRATVRPSARIVATLGVDYQRESGASDGYVDFAPDFRVPNSFDLDRDIVGVFAEGRYLPDEPLDPPGQHPARRSRRGERRDHRQGRRRLRARQWHDTAAGQLGLRLQAAELLCPGQSAGRGAESPPGDEPQRGCGRDPVAAVGRRRGQRHPVRQRLRGPHRLRSGHASATSTGTRSRPGASSSPAPGRFRRR